MGRRSSRYWLYVLPGLHLLACLIVLVGYLPGMHALLLIMPLLVIGDFPISIVGVGLAFSHQVIALLWFVVVGTIWWYLLSLAMRLVLCFIGDIFEDRRSHVISITDQMKDQ